MVKTAAGKPVKDQMRTLARRTLEPHELSSKFQGRLSRLFCRCAGFADSGSCAAMAEGGRVLSEKRAEFPKPRLRAKPRPFATSVATGVSLRSGFHRVSMLNWAAPGF